MAETGVLIVVANFDETGGLQRKYRSLAADLARDRPVAVLTWRAPGHRASGILPDPPGVHVVRSPALLAWDRDRTAPLAALNTALSVGTAVRAALRLRSRWWHAHAAGLVPEGVVVALAARALGRPFSAGAWLPGKLGNVARLERSPLRGLYGSLLGDAEFYLAENAEIERELVAAGFPAERVAVVPSGVATESFPIADERRRREERRRLGLDELRVVLSCGRFDLRQKRFDLLLEAWRLAGLDGWRLVLIGDGPDRARVEALGRGLQPPVHFAGWQRDVRPFLAAADLFAFPTNFEGTGLALMEALAAGLPALASACPPFARLRPDGTVLLPNVASAWAGALVELAADEGSRRRLARQGRRWVEENFDERRSHDAVRARLPRPARMSALFPA